MRKMHISRYFIDLMYYLAGGLLLAISINCFTAPNGIAPGGVTGLATLLYALTGLPIGLVSLVLNLPIFLWGIVQEGWGNMGKSLAGVILSSVMIDLAAPFLPRYFGDGMLIAIFGGVFAGAALALYFMRGGTTGGTDLAAHLLFHRLPHISIGKLILAVDLPIVIASAFVYGKLESPMYALIAIFVTSRVVDAMLHGVNAGAGKVVFIVSKQNHAIRDMILYGLPRGVTELRAQGCYSCLDQSVLLCAVHRNEISRIYRIIYDIDPSAFVIVTDANEITGEGFRPARRS